MGNIASMADLPASFKDIELIILDMDGVLTSEEAYWDAAGLVVRDLLESPAYLGLNPQEYSPIADVFYRKLANGLRSDWRRYLPTPLIVNCKARGINSNWDLAYLTAGIYLVALFAPSFRLFSEFLGINTNREENGENRAGSDSAFRESLSPIWNHLSRAALDGKWGEFFRKKDFYLWGEYFRLMKRSIVPIKKIELLIMDDFHPDMRGLGLLDELNTLLQRHPTRRLPLFGRRTLLWEDCQDLFQEWYLGEELYGETYGRPILYRPKRGLIHKEEPLHGRQKTHACLKKLRQAGYTLGIATGRPRMEIATPLQRWDMLSYFDEKRIVTHDEVEKAEAELKRRGEERNLGKPHPYAFLQAIYPERKPIELASDEGAPIPGAHKILIVGDAVADIWAAQKIHCPCAALLSGALGAGGRKQLEEANPTVLCSHLPELTDAMAALKSGG
ncbi:MAG: HAD family hydrolase [Candidatus Omnitrophota bacterium]